MIRFGGPVFVDSEVAQDPVALAQAHTAKGYTAAYAPPVTLQDSDRVRAYRQAFEDAGVMIAEVGYWGNLRDTDPATRAGNRQAMLEALALAEELGARCAVDVFGSSCHGGIGAEHTAQDFSAEAFEAAVEMARYFLDSVRPRTAYFCYEIFPFNVVDSAAEIDRLIRAVDRPQFGVHLDLVNLINCPRAYWNSGEIMRECVARFGDRIVACHVKDVKLRDGTISVMLEEVPAGQGGIDFATFIRETQALPQEVPFMLEHLDGEEEYDSAAAHIRAVAQSVGVVI